MVHAFSDATVSKTINHKTMERFTVKHIKTKTAAIVAAIVFVISTAFGVGFASAAVTSTAPPAARIGCVASPNRTLTQVYENVPANFKCPTGFPVSLSTAGTTGAEGATGPAGPVGATGASGLEGAYYAVAKYDVGDTNGGAVATVACKATTDVAISGGVQTLAAGTNGLAGNVPVSSSFPGRMDWSTNTPIAGRLDGWIVQFGGNSSSTSLGDPHYEDIYALCVPGADIPVDTTYTESGS
jgi:hypothetical protein